VSEELSCYNSNGCHIVYQFRVTFCRHRGVDIIDAAKLQFTLEEEGESKVVCGEGLIKMNIYFLIQ
jgi:hypothetical protein